MKREGTSTSRRVALLVALIALGVVLLLGSINVGVTIGSEWFGASASSPWHMNNYIVINAEDAYVCFGLGAMALGGLATGIAASTFFNPARRISGKIGLVCAFFVSIFLTGLGFNTLDYMSGNFYWTDLHYPPPVSVPLIGQVDVWNYYFFFFVVPLWIGGFTLGVAASCCIFSYRPRRLGSAYSVNGNFGHLKVKTTLTRKTKEYIVETAAASRKHQRCSRQESFPPVFGGYGGDNVLLDNSRIAFSSGEHDN